MRATLTASLEGNTGEQRQTLLVRDEDRVLTPLWEAIERLVASDGRPSLLPPTLPGRRRRGVTDAPPSAITAEDREDVVDVLDEARLRELVFTEPKVEGRKGRPPRSYRVDAERYGAMFRAFQLLFPEIAATWAPPTPWWTVGDKDDDGDSDVVHSDEVDVSSLEGNRSRNRSC